MAEYQASINEKKAEADLAYDKKKYTLQQEVEKEAMQVEIVKKQKEIELQEQEVLRKAQELDATIRKPAEAEKYRTELSAEADKVKKSMEAEAQAFAIKAEGAAKAEAIKAAGLAEAEVIKAKGEAEAEALAKKAEAYKQFNEAAIAQMVIEKMPEIAAAIAQPLAKTEKIVMIGDSGASKITRDITEIMAQLPETIKGLTGIDLTNILRNYAEPQKAEQADEAKEQQG